jgi:hypothetical protein
MAHKLGGVHADVPLCIMQPRRRLARNIVVSLTRSNLDKIGAVIVRGSLYQRERRLNGRLLIA